jgi:curved DNA-binding protein CbpA
MNQLVHNHYDLLGVSQTATRDEIVAAKHALLRIYQVRSLQNDKQATEILARLNDAHEVLENPVRRAAYDRDFEAIARSYVDVAYPLPLGQFAKLDALAAWLSPPTRTHHDRLEDWAVFHPALDGDSR